MTTDTTYPDFRWLPTKIYSALLERAKQRNRTMRHEVEQILVADLFAGARPAFAPKAPPVAFTVVYRPDGALGPHHDHAGRRFPVYAMVAVPPGAIHFLSAMPDGRLTTILAEDCLLERTED